MKMTIRQGVFETNSSSVHSLTISDQNINEVYMFDIDNSYEFFRDFTKYNSSSQKAAYLYMLFTYNDLPEYVNDLVAMIEKANKCKRPKPIISGYRGEYDFEGGIDGACEYSREDIDFLHANMYNFVYSRNSKIYTGSDESDMNWNLELDAAIKDGVKIIKNG